MQNIVGLPARGDNYYSRKRLEDRLYRRLESGNNIYLSAPRRVGKTSLMRSFEDKPRETFNFVYTSVESVASTEEFFFKILEGLSKSKVLEKQDVMKSKVSKSIVETIKRIKSIEIAGFGIELDADNKENKYYKEFIDLVDKIELNQYLILMIDEFPSAVQNIANRKGTQEAIEFLQKNRTLRQSTNLNFILTGSIGLPSIARSLKVPESINDLTNFELPPFSKIEAEEMTLQILHNENIIVENSAIGLLLDKIQWLIPYFVQLAIQLIIDHYDEHGKFDVKSVDSIYKEMVGRRNFHNFESYFNRLPEVFAENEYQCAKSTLTLLSKDTKEITIEGLFNQLNVDKNIVRNVCDQLIYDGYLFEYEGGMQFNSPIIKYWWITYGQ